MDERVLDSAGPLLILLVVAFIAAATLLALYKLPFTSLAGPLN